MALVLCAALGPGSAWALALLCLGLACVTLACRACLGFAAQRKGLLTWQEPSDVYPRALALFQGLFWVAAALAVAGGLCGMLAFRWQQAEPVQALAGEKRTLRAQVLDYPEERYHRYYYRLQVEALGQEGGPLEEVGPFTLRLSATMPLACQPYDWVECAVTFTAFDSGGGLYSTLNSRLSDGFQAGAYLSQYQGIVVEENPSQPPGELLARMRRQVGRALDKLLPRREAGFLRAMVLGDGSGISETDMGNFRELGVSHILVVSGMHMTVLAAFLQLALKRLPIRKAVGNLLTGLCLLLFLALSGFQPSASRGAAMYGVLLLADSTGRRSDGLTPGAGGAGRVPGQPLCRGRLGLRPVGDGHAGHCAALPPLGTGFPGEAPAGPGLCPVEAGGGLPGGNGGRLAGDLPGAAGGVWGIPPAAAFGQLPHGGPRHGLAVPGFRRFLF